MLSQDDNILIIDASSCAIFYSIILSENQDIINREKLLK